MDPHHGSSMSCELRIIRIKDIDTMKTGEELFVRCNISAGNNKRVRLKTKKISSKSDLSWNQTFSLDCSGTELSIDHLKRESIIFELRSRSNASFIGRMNGSKLIGRAEIPWKHVLESTAMEMERWAVIFPGNGRVHEDVKLPQVQIAIRIQETRRKNLRMEEDHPYSGCNCCVDSEYFAIGADLEDAL